MHPAHDYFHEEPRITRAGRVASTPYPYLALLAELDGRYAKLMETDKGQHREMWHTYKDECHGIVIGLSCISGDSIENLSKLAHDRYVSRVNGTPLPEYSASRGGVLN